MLCGENLCKDVVCDDGNRRTDETCDYANGTCNFVPESNGTGCGDIPEVSGVCLDGNCVEACDRSAQEEYQCPIDGLEHLLCCPYFDQCIPDWDWFYGADWFRSNSRAQVLRFERTGHAPFVDIALLWLSFCWHA